MTRLARAFIASGIVGAIGLVICMTPLRRTLEEGFGLGLLFTLRGARPAPDDVVVVAIDKPSIDRLQLPTNTHKWPRNLHARVINRLRRENPAVIVLDILFNDAGVPGHDVLLAQAIRNSGNVILAEYLRQDAAPLLDTRGAQYGTLNMERVIPPIASLQQACLTSAPFPLPRIPVRLNSYWAFKTEAGDLPTLPVVAFQAFAGPAYHLFVELAQASGLDDQGPVPPQWQTVIEQKKLREIVSAFHLFFSQKPEAVPKMLSDIEDASSEEAGASDRRLLRALANMYRRPNIRYLNFYGPPGSITTLSYHRLVGSTPQPGRLAPLPELSGKAIFVGAAGLAPQEQKDGFYTVFSQPDGLDISGVEIAATAFANILEDEPVRPLPLGSYLTLILTWGLALGLLCGHFSSPIAYPTITILSLAYGFTAYQQFATAGRWLPVFIPLFIQMPVAVVGSLIWNYIEASRERQNIRTAFEFYLPDDVVAQLARSVESIGHQQVVYGACLFTDAQNYTEVSEKMAPQELSHFVNRYLRVLFEPVRRTGGVISDIKGDSILAIWPAGGPEPAIRQRACQAALEMDLAVARFNQSEKANDRELPTRMGLHAGYLSLGNVGAVDHFEYRPVGDAVNTAARLEALNKQLGTSILVSEEVLDQIEDFVARPLGRFMLAGKSQPVAVCELIGRVNEVHSRKILMCAHFKRALEAFQRGAFDESWELFQRLAAQGTKDGPARFYRRLCQQYRANPPEEGWDGTVYVA